jgi:hypothetical protein
MNVAVLKALMADPSTFEYVDAAPLRQPTQRPEHPGTWLSA